MNRIVNMSETEGQQRMIHLASPVSIPKAPGRTVRELSAAQPSTRTCCSKPADVELAEKARQLAREKNIPIDEAQRLAFRQFPELARAWQRDLHA